MSDPTASPPRTGGLLRKLLIALAALVLLLVVAYFVVSSSSFVRSVVLPKVGKSLNAEVSAADVSFHPFSELVLNKLSVRPLGAEPLLTAESVRVRYRLGSILRGNYVVDELTVASPVITISKDPAGKSNLDALSGEQGQATPTEPKSGKPLQLALRNLAVKDGIVRSTTRNADGAAQTLELARLNLNVDRIENGQSGKATLATALHLQSKTAGATPTNGVIDGTVEGAFDFKLSETLAPKSVNGSASLSTTRGEGAYADLAGFSSRLDAQISPTEIQQLAVLFQRNGQPLGKVQASGPLDLAKTEGRIKLEIQSIDRQVLNLFGASKGWDFADTRINATNVIDLAQQGRQLGVKGHLVSQQFSLREEGQTTPPVDLDADYEMSVDLDNQSAVIRRLSLTGQQRGTNLLDASLDRPMTLTWAPNARGFAESTFQVNLSHFRLSDWPTLVGTNVSNGELALQWNVIAKQDGKDLQTKANGTLQDLAAQWSTNRIAGLGATFRLEASLSDFKTIRLNRYELALQEGDRPLGRTSGSGTYDLARASASMQANAEIELAALAQHLPAETLTASAGVLRLSSSITSKDHKYSCTGNLAVTEFTGTVGAYALKDLKSALDCNLDYEASVLQIHSASLNLGQGYRSGGTLGLRGDYDMGKGTAHLTWTAVGLNENALGPILAQSMNESNRLSSISVKGAGSATYDPAGESAFKANLTVTNWVVTGLSDSTNSNTLGGELQLDTVLRQRLIELRQCSVKLAPTPRASNQLSISGRIDLATNNATPSQLTVRSESLDLTPYYAIFAGPKAQPQKPAAPREASAASKTSAPSPAPPGANPLPLQTLVADAKLDRLYFGELAVTNLQLAARVDGPAVTVKPFEMTVNGAPLSANLALDLSKPGYVYELAFKTEGLPVEPLSRTFTTNAPGAYGALASLSAQAQVTGTGLSAPDLQKNVSGSIAATLTNLNYGVVAPKIQRLLEPIALVLQVPELTQTPLNYLTTQIALGQAKIDLQDFVLQSQAFHAETRGVIPMADVLTNSPIKLPVELALRRSLAEKARLLSAGTPTNTDYVTLPTFVTLSGTIGEPKTEINKLVVAGLAARSIGNIAPVGEKAGTILQGLGGLLTGQQSAPAATNAPTRTNATSPANLIQDLSGILGSQTSGRRATNPAAGANPAGAVATNTSARTNPASPAPVVQDITSLLNQLSRRPRATNSVSTNPPARAPK